MKAVLYNTDKKNNKEIEIPKEVFDVSLNSNLLHQVVRSQMQNRRQNTAHTKDRSEVRGGGRKPWRQKGTGRARHGSRRSPIWKGGGVTFGPRNERNFKNKINKKMRRKATLMVLSEKFRNSFVYFVADVKMEKPKTKEMADFFAQLPYSGSALLILPNMEKNTILSVRNIDRVDTVQAKDINSLDLLSYKHLLICESAIDVIKENFIDKESHGK